MLLLDAGRSMAARVPVAEDPSGAPPLTRLDYAVNACLLFAFVALGRGDRVGLLSFSDRVTRYVGPGRGRRHFLNITEALYDLEPELVESDYGVALHYLAARNPRRSLSLVFTDIVGSDEASELVSYLGALARKHVPLVVTLRDPALEALASQTPDDTDKLYRRAVAMVTLDERETVLRRLRSAGAMTLDVAADKLSPALINRYLEIKGRGKL
jgi:uncharacterized protein (DUF58 family)